MGERTIKLSLKTKETTVKLVPAPSVQKPCGLENYGNTCFFNSALQLFSSSFRFLAFSKNLKEHDGQDDLLDYLDTFLKLEDKNRHRDFVDKVYEKKTTWDLNQQQDCHECMIFILDLLDNTLKLPENPKWNARKVSLGKGYEEIMRSFGNYYWKEHTHRMHDIVKSFYGLYHSATTCSICKNENNKWDPFSNITLTTEYKNFKDFLENFSKEETIEEYECEKCKKKN